MISKLRGDVVSRQAACARRYALLLGTRLSTGTIGFAAIALISPALGADVNLTITAPRDRVQQLVSGNDKLNITSSASGTITHSGSSALAVAAYAEGGDTRLDFNGDVTGVGGVEAYSSTGAVTVTGTGHIFASDGYALNANSDFGSVTVSGAGTTSGRGGIFVFVDGNSDILINRSGAITAASLSGIVARNNAGNGKIYIYGIGPISAVGGIGIFTRSYFGSINIGIDPLAITLADGAAAKLSSAITGAQGIQAVADNGVTIAIASRAGGTVTATNGAGINTSAVNGATTIDIGANVSGTTSGIQASTTGSGNNTIKVASGVSIAGTSVAGISSSAATGVNTIDIAGQITGRSGIITTSTGTGSTAITTRSGGAVVGTVAEGVKTSAVNGATSIDIGANVSGATHGLFTTSTGTGATSINIAAGAQVTGGASALNLVTRNGNVGVTNGGMISGNVSAVTTAGGVGSFSFVNTGAVKLAAGQSVTGFQSFTHASGGLLTGLGNFGDVTAQSGSLIRAGDQTLASTGTTRFGSLNLQSGSVLELRAKADGNADSIAATHATIASGAKLAVLASPNDKAFWSTKKIYNVLTTSGALVGGFAAADVTSDLAFLRVKTATSADGRNIELSLQRNTVEFSEFAATKTQTNVATVIQSAPANVSGKAESFIEALLNVTAAQAPAAMESLAGRGAAAAQAAGFGAMSGFAAVLQNRGATFMSAQGGSGAGAALAYAGTDISPAAQPFAHVKGGKSDTRAPSLLAPGETWRAWATLTGGANSTSARQDTGSPEVRGQDWGGAAGLEFAVSTDTIAGLAIGGSHAPFSVGSGATRGATTGGLVSLYSTTMFDLVYASGALTYGRLGTDTTRKVTVGASDEIQKMKADADAYSASLEVGYRLPLEAYVVSPFVTIQPALLRQHASRETADAGPSLYGLDYKARSTISLPVSLGMQVERGFDMDGGWRALATLRAAWVHETRPARNLQASFVVLPGSTFEAEGAAATPNAALVSGGLKMANTDGLSIFAGFTANLSSGYRSLSGQGGVKLAW